MLDLIEQRIKEFVHDRDPKLEWVRAAAERYGFLPLHLGWVEVIGLQPDSAFVCWDHEKDRVTPLTDLYWQRMGICAGAMKYPELAALIPARPAHAQDCPVCKGTGHTALPQVICGCGSLGWILPGELSQPSPA